MTRLALILLLLVAAAAQQPAPAGSQAVPAVQENEQKARAVLDRMIQALGGQAWLNVSDYEEQGRAYSFYHGQAQGAGTVYWRFWKWPDKERVELTKQRDVIEIYNGERGWETTYKGTHAQDPKDLAKYQQRRHYSLPQVVRGWLKQPGIALFYEGTSLANGRPVEQVTILNARNENVTLYVSSDSHLPLKLSYQVRDPQYRELDTESVVFDNYRPEQGVQTPHSVTFYHNGDMSAQRFVNSVRYNLSLPDAQFTATVTTPPLPKKIESSGHRRVKTFHRRDRRGRPETNSPRVSSFARRSRAEDLTTSSAQPLRRWRRQSPDPPTSLRSVEG